MLLVAMIVLCVDRQREPDSVVNSGVADSGPPHVNWSLMVAGLATGIAILAKTEMGFAALCAGVIAVALVGYPSVRRAIPLAAMFVAPAAVLVLGAYGYIASRVGWHTLVGDSFLFIRYIRPELDYFIK